MTNACNQSCPHCFGFDPQRDGARLSWDDARRIIDSAVEAGVRGLTFTGGGEPLVNPETPRAVAYAAKLGLDVGFITNAQALPAAAADILLGGCVWLRVSLDAATPEVFRRTHGGGPEQFARVLDNIRLLVRRKAETGSRTTLGLGFLTSPGTAADIYGFAALGRELGVDYAQYRPLLRRRGEAEIDYSDGKMLAEMERAAREFSSETYRVVCSEHKYRRIAEGRIGRGYRRCYGQHFAMVAAADQKMYVCCHMRGVAKYAVGDLKRQSIAEVCDSAERLRTAESIDFQDCPPLCRCDSFNGILWDLKQGGCSLDDAPADKGWEHRNFI